MAVKNDTNNSMLLNKKLKANTKQDYIEPNKLSLKKGNKNLNLLDLNNKAIKDNQLKDQEYDNNDRADASMLNIRYTFLVDVIVDIIVDVIEDVKEDLIVNVIVNANNYIETLSNYISTTSRAERT